MRDTTINFLTVSQCGEEHPTDAGRFQVCGVAFNDSEAEVSIEVYVNTKSQAFDMAKKLFGSTMIIQKEEEVRE